MKRIMTLILALIFVVLTAPSLALTPFWFNGVALNSTGDILDNMTVNARITILDGNVPIGSQTFNGISTDQFGGFALLVDDAFIGPINVNANTRIQVEVQELLGPWVLSAVSSLAMVQVNTTVQPGNINLTLSHILIGDESNHGQDLPVGGELTGTNTGVAASLIINDNAITLNKMADNSVGSAEIIDGSIVNADINAAAAIDVTKLAAGAPNQFLLNNGTNVWAGFNRNATLVGNGIGTALGLNLNNPNTWVATQTFGAIDAASIGATTPGTGAFTNLSASGNTTLGTTTANNVLIRGQIQNDLIGTDVLINDNLTIMAPNGFRFGPGQQVNGIVTTIATPGSNANLPTEKAVRDAVTAVEAYPFVTVGNVAGLTAERAIANDATLIATDGGANASYTLGINLATPNTWTGVQTLPANATQGDNLIAAVNSGTGKINYARLNLTNSILPADLTVGDYSGKITSGTYSINITGNAGTATALQTARNFSVSGDASTALPVSFNGTADVNLAVTLANSGVAAATYGSATQVGQFAVDVKGRITSAANVSIAIPPSQITGGSTGNIIIMNGSPTWTAVTGDIALTGAGAVTIQNSAGNNIVAAINNVATTNRITVDRLIAGGANQFLTSDGLVDSWNALNINTTLTGNGVATPLGINLATPNTWTGVQTLPANVTQGDNLIAAVNSGTGKINYARLNLTNSILPADLTVGDYSAKITSGTYSINITGNAATATTANAVANALTIGTGLSGTAATYNGSAAVTVSLPNVGTAGTYGSAANVPVFATDAQGRVSSVTNTAIAIAESQVTNLTTDLAAKANLSGATFTGAISATNLSGTNTGDVTIGVPANGLSLAGQVLSLGLASGTTIGALSNTDWTTFNNKQAAGNYITALTGDVTAAGPGSAAATVASVGGVTAANVASGANLANAATNLNTASTIVRRDASGNFTAGTITANLTGNVTGNASTATALQTARTINGVAFDGTANITVTADAGTLTGTTLNATVVNSSLTSVGTLTNLTVTNPINGSITGNAATATLATTATNIAGGALGSVPYQSAAGTTALLAGNTAATKMFLSQTGTGLVSAAPSWSAVTKTDVGLGLVENTALSTWVGSANITTLGTITAGTWNGTNLTESQVTNLTTDLAAKANLSGATFTGAISATNLSGTNTGDVTIGVPANGLSLAGQVLSLGLASGATIGALSSTDWTTFNNKQAAGNYITALTGDVTAAGPGSAAATVASVGGVTAANVASGANLANAATNLNTASTIVRRDASGNFTAGTITANLTGNVSGSAASFTGALVGDVTGTQGATVVSTVGGVTAANVASGANLANAATNLNTASTIVRRDASGNFAAGTITANLTGNVTGNASTATTATNIAGGALGDVPYQSAAGTTALLAGNITTTKMFLSQTGTSLVSAAPSWSAVTKTDVGLGLVENTALSTWVGSANITTLGTITGGATWTATAIADAYVADNLTISGGTVNNTPIGATTPSTGAFTTLTASGTISHNGTTQGTIQDATATATPITATATIVNIGTLASAKTFAAGATGQIVFVIGVAAGANTFAGRTFTQGATFVYSGTAWVCTGLY